MDPDTFFSRVRKFLIEFLTKESRMGAKRSQTTTWIRFRKDGEMVELAVNSRMLNVYNLSNMNKIVNAMISHIKQQIENPALSDSKFIFDEVLHMDVNFHQLNLTRGSSYLPVPDRFVRKGAIINPKNSDLECFKWAIIAAMRWEEIGRDPQRISKLKRFEPDFDWTGIGLPVSFRDIKKFESRNQISVNILAEENKQIYICRKWGNYERITNLMLITEDNHKHYVAIKLLSRLLSSKNNKHNGAQYFCTNCLQGYFNESSIDEHFRYCTNNEAVCVEMPRRKPIVEYSDGQYQYKVPFIMYADFESILEPISRQGPKLRISSTRGVNVHTPFGWCVRSEFAYGEIKDPLKLYRGKDRVSKFCEHIIGEDRRLYNSFSEKPMTPLTKDQIKKYNRVSKCQICFKHFKDGDRKVRDHCHYSGEYRGAAHSLCNLQYKIPSYIPVVFYNLTGYDAHLFIWELSKYGPQVGVTAKNTEDYISFSIKVEVGKYVDKNGEERSNEIDLRFIDSIKFMSSSLDLLVNNLTKGGNDCGVGAKPQFFDFDEYNEHQHELLIRKGIYPYEYLDSWDRFEETKLRSQV